MKTTDQDRTFQNLEFTLNEYLDRMGRLQDAELDSNRRLAMDLVREHMSDAVALIRDVLLNLRRRYRLEVKSRDRAIVVRVTDCTTTPTYSPYGMKCTIAFTLEVWGLGAQSGICYDSLSLCMTAPSFEAFTHLLINEPDKASSNILGGQR